ncbi:MAG TPA: BON domain-containing protein [Burkholderiaceae bacterium]|jgi:osmotically-inducible protein OsmY|nr:BON domain-containing protein [Burkholderiaceae bacterium]
MITSRHLTTFALVAVLSGAAYAQGSAEDQQIRAEVQKQISEQPSLKFHNISVRTVNHVVYLGGLVDTRAERHQAGHIAGSIPGVTKVYNDVVLNANS